MFDIKKEVGDFTWMHSEQPDAFVNTGKDNNFLDFFDSFLLYGFNERVTIGVSVIDNLTIKLTYEFPHGYEPRQNIDISGSNIQKLNGKYKIYEVDSHTVSIKIRDIIGDIGAVLTTKISPLGFSNILDEETSLTGKRAFRSNNLDGTRMVLYMDVNYTPPIAINKTQPMRGVELNICRDISSSGVPKDGFIPMTKNYWFQTKNETWSGLSAPSKRNWVVFGNGDYFYLFYVWSTYSTANNIYNRDFYSFGDIDYINKDVGCILTSSIYSSGYQESPSTSAGAVKKMAYDTFGIYCIITPSGFEYMSKSPYGGVNGFSSGAESEIVFPNPSTNTMILTPVYATANNTIHGKFYRMRGIPHNINGIAKEVLDKKIKDDTLLISVRNGRWLAFDVGYQHG